MDKDNKGNLKSKFHRIILSKIKTTYTIIFFLQDTEANQLILFRELLQEDLYSSR